ncbi:hypothetical protein FO519_009686 [Halicephalobus sp. NKZ332]|nr:hypothetical protein FO519_009686 [Halicephalobus sp. NKZ332]
MANEDLDTLLSILDEDDDESLFLNEGSVTETDASYVTANETMSNMREKVEDCSSQFLDFEDDVFLPEDIKTPKLSTSIVKVEQEDQEDESSFRTCDQTVINVRDENKTPVPGLDFDEDNSEIWRNPIQSGSQTRTPQIVKAELMAEFLSRRDSTTVVKKEVNNSRVFLGEFRSKNSEDLGSKTEDLKKALKKEDGIKAFDPFFGIKIKDPKVPSEVFSTYCTGFTKFKLSNLRPANAPKSDWVTMGVIVEKAEYRKSAKNNEYMIWKISDLKNFQDTPVKVLLFGNSVQEHWKLLEGNVVALMSPQFAESTENKGVTLKVSKSAQVVHLGICPEFGRCKGIKMDGNRCSQHVNISSTEYCIYHVTKAANSTSARRGALSSEFNSPIGRKVSKHLGDTKNENSGPHVFIRAGIKKEELLSPNSKPKTQKISKEELKSLKEAELEKLEVLKSRKFSFATRNVKLQKKEDPQTSTEKNDEKPVDLKTFLKEQMKKRMSSSRPPATDASSSRPPMMELVIEKPLDYRKSKADLNRQRLIEKIRQEGGLKKVDPNRFEKSKNQRALVSGSDSDKENQFETKYRPVGSTSSFDSDAGSQFEDKKGIKRRFDSGGSQVEAKKAKFTTSNGKVYSDKDIDALLSQKSLHEDFIDEAEKSKEESYFRSMEVREKFESKMTEIKEIKDVRVITCKKCDYTSQKQSSFCMIQGHHVQWHKATKRFFKCQVCKHRIGIFDFIPTKPCEKCGCTSFDKVGMVDERKVELNKLIIRGEERKFVNK